MATDSNRRDLNHPYAYAYAIPAAAANNPDFSVHSQNAEAQLHPKSSYVSTLVSAGVHAVILVTGALIFATVPKSPAIEIVMTKAPVASEQPVETFVMDSQPDAPETDEPPPSADIPQSNFQIAELSLAANIDVGKATQAEAAGPAETAKDGNSGRGSEFFGMAAYGDKFVYVMDVSGSMAQRSHLNDYEYEPSPSTSQERRLHLGSIRRRTHTRFEVAEHELLRSINQLEEDQWFCVMLFNSETHPMFEQTPRLIAATQENKDRIREWMSESGPGGGTDPTGGLARGFEMQPDAVFLLSDGEFTSGHAAERVVDRNLHREIPLHTIAFESPSSRRRLRSMSEVTNGRHRYVGSQTRQELIVFDVRSGGREAIEALQKVIDGDVPLGLKEKAELGLECCRLLLTGPRVTSRLAHECMLAMADGEDFGPANRGKRQVVLRSARKWRQYWQQLPK